MASGGKGRKKLKRIGSFIRWALVLLLITGFGFSIYCAVSGTKPADVFSLPESAPASAESQWQARLRVYMLDVGQGDCSLIISPSGRTMLIDSGESSAYPTIHSFLTGLGIERLDAIVASHPHSDHIGSMEDIINTFDVGTVYMPEADGMSDVYDGMMLAIERKAIPITYISAESTPLITWDDDVEVRVLSPFQDLAYPGLNDYSAIIRISYGNTSALFTGDAEGGTPQSAEYAALSRFPAERFSSTVLKVGHHGSFTSTSDSFLQAANPEYALISAGKDNEYGHPSASVLSRLDAHGAKVFRTDLHGHILAELDGQRATVSPVSAPSQSIAQMFEDIWEHIKDVWVSFLSIFE